MMLGLTRHRAKYSTASEQPDQTAVASIAFRRWRHTCSESPRGSNNPPAQVSADFGKEFRVERFPLTVKLGLKPGLQMTRDEAITEITHKLVEFYQPIRI